MRHCAENIIYRRLNNIDYYNRLHSEIESESNDETLGIFCCRTVDIRVKIADRSQLKI